MSNLLESSFRFMLACEGASQRESDGVTTAHAIVNELAVRRGEPLKLVVLVGVILDPSMTGARLDLLAWRMGPKGEPLRLRDYVGTPLLLPDGKGPQCLAFDVELPIDATDIYGLYLFDADGQFGAKSRLLATYVFSAVVD